MNAEIADAGGCRIAPLSIRPRRGKQDAFLDIGRRLSTGLSGAPPVCIRRRRRFDRDTSRKAVERGNLPAKWRSGIAAENECHRLLAILVGQTDHAAMVERGQFKIGRGVPYAELSRAGIHPKRLERQDHHGDAWNLRHDGAESFRRLPHGGVDLQRRPRRRAQRPQTKASPMVFSRIPKKRTLTPIGTGAADRIRGSGRIRAKQYRFPANRSSGDSPR